MNDMCFFLAFCLFCPALKCRQLMWFATMTIAPVGAAFGVPVLALAVRRYTHRRCHRMPLPKTRTFGAFGGQVLMILRNVVNRTVDFEVWDLKCSERGETGVLMIWQGESGLCIFLLLLYAMPGMFVGKCSHQRRARRDAGWSRDPWSTSVELRTPKALSNLSIEVRISWMRMVLGLSFSCRHWVSWYLDVSVAIPQSVQYWWAICDQGVLCVLSTLWLHRSLSVTFRSSLICPWRCGATGRFITVILNQKPNIKMSRCMNLRSVSEFHPPNQNGVAGSWVLQVQTGLLYSLNLS